MKPWLSVVGIGEDGVEGLSAAARGLLGSAEVLVGGERHLAMVPEDGRERLVWPSPLQALIGEIEALRGRAVCVLATGDPMAYGIGITLGRHIAREEMVILPGVSAFSLAAARLGWNPAECACLTLHGRPLSLLESAIQPGARLLILSEDGGTPAAVAARLKARGFGPSRMAVFEHMGGPGESRREAMAEDWEPAGSADLNTIAVDCRSGPQARVLPRLAGLPDDAYRHDGQLTKREVRAATLVRLAPAPGQCLWDVGAGAGSIAIEWLRAAPTSEAIAIERDQARIAFIAENAEALGAPHLRIVEGAAPAALEGLPAPDAVFVGGGVASEGLLEAAWAALRPGGRLVANAVTLEGEAALMAAWQRCGGDMLRLSVSRLAPIGPRHGWRPLMTVTQLAAVKT
jgi:precorrin-6Y C5,15-methyltransferase (decarboxylating)